MYGLFYQYILLSQKSPRCKHIVARYVYKEKFVASFQLANNIKILVIKPNGILKDNSHPIHFSFE